MCEIFNDCMPTKKVKYNKHKHKKSEWITKGIIKSIQFRDNLYLQMKRTPPNTIAYTTIKTNLKTYNKILKNNIDQAKRTYYQHSFDKYKNDTKNTWKIIKEITNINNIKKHIPCLFKGMCPKIPLCVICVHSYTNIL